MKFADGGNKKKTQVPRQTWIDRPQDQVFNSNATHQQLVKIYNIPEP